MYLDVLMAQWAFEVTEPAEVTQTVPTITGRPAIASGEWAAAHREVFLSAWTPGTGTGG